MTLPATGIQAQGSGEDTLSLNATWLFQTDPNNTGEQQGWYTTGLADNGWDKMTVPGNWDTRNEYAHYAGKSWYRRQIVVPAGWKNKLVRLQFEAVYHDSKIWINGQLLGSSHSGFLPFEFDVSNLSNYGGQNTIVVCADNSFRRGAIWNWGGIRRPVQLVAGSSVRVVRQQIEPVINLQKQTATVTVKVVIHNAGTSPANIQGAAVLSAPNGFRRSLPFTGTVAAADTQTLTVATTITGKEVHLWSFDDPFLYTSTVTIGQERGAPSAKTDRFGLRKIDIDNSRYTLSLNGEPIRPMGFNLVPDDRTNGSTLPLWRIKEDIDLMKSLGANMMRLSHLPLPKEAMDYLDEKGIMIFDEIPLWGFDRLADKDQPLPKAWLKQLMERDYNHPSVIGWCVGNEIGQYPKTMEYVQHAIEYIHRQDSLHLGVMVSHTADQKTDPIQYSDLGLINKYGSAIGRLADKIHEYHPEKVLFYTEYGYGQLGEDLNTDAPAQAMLDSMRFKPWLIGASLWTFNDYRSSFIGTREPSENRSWGIVDVFRRKKRAFYSFRKEYAPVRGLTITDLQQGTTNTANLVLTPRKLLDLPAYTLRNYQAVWTAVDAHDQVITGGIVSLPVIKPGDAELRYPIQWTANTAIKALRIELLSPLQYSVYDTLINLQAPAVPAVGYATGVRIEMNNMFNNAAGLRVQFPTDPQVKAYKLRYGKDGQMQESAPTVNHYIDVQKLNFYENYQYQLVAINDAGETASPVKNVQIGYGSAPPVIYYTEAADGGFFVGHASQADDYLYRIQYTTSKGDYTQVPTIQSTTKGLLFVSGLKNGQTYYFRLQTVKHNFSDSEWSEEIAVTPDGGQLPAAPQVRGLLRDKTQALLFFTPVKKAIGYQVQYRSGNGNWQQLTITQAGSQHVLLTNLPKGVVECRIATISANGQSAFSAGISK